MSARHPEQSAEDLTDSDWEYEYDEMETESFFVTLDLSSTPLTRANKNQKTDGATGKAKQPAGASATINAATQISEVTDSLDTLDPDDRVQILDLHTSNPVISYQNHVYTCQWTSTLGTDILLTPPDPSPPFPPLYKDTGFDILAMPTIKLVGQPVQLARRSGGHAEPTDTAPAASSILPTIIGTVEANSSNPPEPTPVPPAPTAVPKPVYIPVLPSAPRSKQNQARFLERLIAVKAAKGERDSVTVHSRRRLTGTGWRSWREQAAPDGSGIQRPERLTNLVPIQSIEEDDQVDDADQNSLVTRSTQDGMPRKKVGRPPALGTRSGQRKITRLGRTGGLFRDYRPAPGDEEGADIRGIGDGGGMVDRTPGTWDELMGRDSSEGELLESFGDGEGAGSNSARIGIEDAGGDNVDPDGLLEGQDDDADVVMEDAG